MEISNKLLSMLVCPKCKSKVKFSYSYNGLLCINCNLIYCIKDGIPIMLVESAKKLEK